MADIENDPLSEQIEAAVRAGDSRTVAELISSEGRNTWIAKTTQQEARATAEKSAWPIWALLRSVFMLRSVVSDRFLVSKAEINALRKRIEELERRVPDYLGTWSAEKAPYKPNELITDSSSLWICRRTTSDRPPSDSWQLVVKSPR
jgi:hypothetical protein